jgi:hypothetical protein
MPAGVARICDRPGAGAPRAYTCVAGSGACSHTNGTAGCDDGDACTQGDVCSAGACVPGAPEDCSDGDACTADLCAAGTCSNVPIPGCGADAADDADGATDAPLDTPPEAVFDAPPEAPADVSAPDAEPEAPAGVDAEPDASDVSSPPKANDEGCNCRLAARSPVDAGGGTGACGSGDGWYYDDAVAPTKLIPCPASCATIDSDAAAKLEIRGCV